MTFTKTFPYNEKANFYDGFLMHWFTMAESLEMLDDPCLRTTWDRRAFKDLQR